MNHDPESWLQILQKFYKYRKKHSNTERKKSILIDGQTLQTRLMSD